jgi:hypothetical protein
MAQHTPQVMLDLLRVTEQRDELAKALRECLNYIETAMEGKDLRQSPTARQAIRDARAALANVTLWTPLAIGGGPRPDTVSVMNRLFLWLRTIWSKQTTFGPRANMPIKAFRAVTQNEDPERAQNRIHHLPWCAWTIVTTRKIDGTIDAAG